MFAHHNVEMCAESLDAFQIRQEVHAVLITVHRDCSMQSSMCTSHSQARCAGMIATPTASRPVRSQAFFGTPAICRHSVGLRAARPVGRSTDSTTCKAQDPSHSVICFGEALFGE